MFLHENSALFRSGRRPLAALLGFFLFFGAGASAFGAPSVEEMAGQMLLVGFRGQEPEACGAILEDIRVRHLGGVILFKRDARNPLIGRNIRDAAQVKRLTSALREAAPPTVPRSSPWIRKAARWRGSCRATGFRRFRPPPSWAGECPKPPGARPFAWERCCAIWG